ncbi:hypothetical protein [Rosenbergiella epipactidis]|uniref:hypothetical protein n=1 Tax=Rosenbergiella epipactidis TaxID=1544694 RepID=UPI001F4EE6E4|nr:hypothetical protein [Rosenbergiella epipactidis]
MKKGFYKRLCIVLVPILLLFGAIYSYEKFREITTDSIVCEGGQCELKDSIQSYLSQSLRNIDYYDAGLKDGDHIIYSFIGAMPLLVSNATLSGKAVEVRDGNHQKINAHFNVLGKDLIFSDGDIPLYLAADEYPNIFQLACGTVAPNNIYSNGLVGLTCLSSNHERMEILIDPISKGAFNSAKAAVEKLNKKLMFNMAITALLPLIAFFFLSGVVYLVLRAYRFVSQGR